MFSEPKLASENLGLYTKQYGNSKQQFHSSNKLGNAVVFNDRKPEFLAAVANWVELWSCSPHFTLSTQTSKAIESSINVN